MKFPWAASGRAIANARDEGFSKLTFDHDTHRIVGGGIVGIVGIGAGDLISELALASLRRPAWRLKAADGGR